MIKNNTFLRFLKVKFGEIIYYKVKGYLIANRHKLLNLLNKDIAYINTVEDIELDYKQVWIDNKVDNKIDFDIAIEVDADLNVYNKRMKEQYTDSIRIWLLVTCCGDLSKKLKDFKIYGVEEFVKSRPKKPMSGDLVPIIFRTEYEKYGEEILKKYYPEGLINDNKIDIMKLVTNMGLRVFATKISEDQSVYGQLYFEKTLTNIYSVKNKKWKEIKIPSNTIIVDKEAVMNANETVDLVIAHECIHYVLHKSAFLFSQLFHDNLHILECEKSGKIKGIDNNDKIMWMEVQANGLAPYILLPTIPFKNKVKKTLEKYNITDTISLLNNIETVIDELAEYYNVTKEVIKIRMIDIGYPEVASAYNFVDGVYVNPFAYSKKAIDGKIVYTIEAKEIKHIMVINKKLSDRIEKGYYLYIDSHLVFNHPKYIKKLNNGYLTLSEYARENIEECCLSFDIEYENKKIYYQEHYLIYYLNKNIKVPYEQKVVFHNGYENCINDDTKNKYYIEAIKEQQEIYNKLTTNFTECLKILKKWRKVTNEWIANKMHLSEKTVERILSGETEPSYQKLCSFLLVLKIPYSISKHIESIAPKGFDSCNEEHWYLRQLLMVNYGMEMEQIREEAKKFNICL